MFGNFQLTSLAVIPVLGLLIFVHELGHFLAARWMGVRVHEFGFGYPPRMLKLFERNGVEYTLNWLPFGGFVRMAGEDDDFDAPDALPNVAPWRRIVVMAAGPVMNLVAAVLIFATMFMIGTPTYIGDPDKARVEIVAVAENSPADMAGVQAGDIILTIAGEEMYGIDAVSEAINSRAGQQVEITLQRGDEIVTVSLTPRLPEQIPPGQGASGVQIATYMNPEDIRIVRQNPVAALLGGIRHTAEMITMMIAGLAELIRAAIAPDVPAPQGGVGGLVAIGRIAAQVAEEGLSDLLNLTAFLSINLAILNLFPIPALDGGRIVFAAAEMVRRKRIPPEKEALVHFAGFAILIAFMLIITFVDISNWLAGKPPLPGG
ncbi:MAG: PDZ domain-containing protein [Caldilineae bacterium]|nr:MAG: PDZ domain-containing protein [Caldilineae bacterium]